MSEISGVYRHVVLFRFKSGLPEGVVQGIEKAFADLCAELPFVTGFEWGLNSSPEDLNMGFTHCFVVTFNDPSGRDLYLPHPLHQQFCKEHLDPSLEAVCVVDFSPQLLLRKY